MSRVRTRIALVGSGAVLGLIGGFILFAPRIFLATGEVIIDHDPSLMSEVTAPSGLLIVTGALMVLGAIKLRFANVGLVIGAIVYGSYGISRMISMHLHGIPSDSLVIATQVELGIAALLVALRLTEPSAKRSNMADIYRGGEVV